MGTVDCCQSVREDDIPVSSYVDSPIPRKTKKSINAAYLLATIIAEYFESDCNRCQQMDDHANGSLIADICDNIFIQGGACRDILLMKPVNDIDLVVNTRELTKIQQHHLRTFHSDANQQGDTKCALWRLYLKKFEGETKEYDANLENVDRCSYEYVRKCPYILNAQYIAAIFAQSTRFEGRSEVKDWSHPLVEVFTINITAELLFNGFDLNKEEVDLVDVFPRDYTQFHEMVSTDNHSHFVLKSDDMESKQIMFHHPIMSRTVSTKAIKEAIDEMKQSEETAIDIPIYETKIQQQMEGNDLSINCCILSLFAIKEVIDPHFKRSEVGDEVHCFEITDSLYDDIKNKVNDLTVYDLKRDLREKLLTSTLKAVVVHGPAVHFWRVIKFAVRYHDEGWTVNPELVTNHQGLYEQWIDSDEYLEKEENQKYLVQQNLKYGLATTVKEYGDMVKAFKVMGFEERLKSALHRNESFREKWTTALKEQDEGVIEVFTAHGYL